MKRIIIIVLVLLNINAKSQDNDPWFAFWNKDTTLIGFKDKKGEIKIEPKFVGFTTAQRFNNIIAVIEDDKGTFNGYYLTKDQKKVGVDSLFMYDNGSDCESEGFIRFLDKKSELVGMLNRNGKVAVPAEYSALSRVENGLIVALKGAKKKYIHKFNNSGCNHYRWKGGKQFLIDTNNKILIEDFEYSRYLNLFSIEKESKPAEDSARKTFKGLNGQLYSFIDYKKEFNYMINSFLANSVSQENLKNICHNRIYFWKDEIGWISESKEDYLDNNFIFIKEKLLQLDKENTDFNIFLQGLNPYIYEGAEFEKYFNNCREAKETRYPVMDVVINNNSNEELIQDSFEFLRTEYGYKLISATIRSEK